MSGLPWSSSQLILFFFALLSFAYRVDAADQKGVISGSPEANLRTGPGLESAIKITLKEGDQVVVEKAEGEWYQVTAADGQKGFIHRSLVKIAGDTPAPVTPGAALATPQKAAAIEAKEPGSGPTRPPLPAASSAPTTSSPPQAVPRPASKAAPPITTPSPAQPAAAKPQSILQMIEGHENEFKIALLIAGGSFVLGWICGGSYYVRRERKRRGKLSF
jgi:hypothetical protein